MADPSELPPLPKNHLDHPEQWATGGEPATEKQKGFISVLEKQHQELVPENGLDVAGMGKSEASEVIDKLKSGRKVDPAIEKAKEDVQKGSTAQEGGSMEEMAAAEMEAKEEEKEKEKETTPQPQASEGNHEAVKPTPKSNSKTEKDVFGPVETTPQSNGSKRRRSSVSVAKQSQAAKKAAKGDISTDADDEMEEENHTKSQPKEGGSLSSSARGGNVADDEKEKEDQGHVEKKAKKEEDTIARPTDPVPKDRSDPASVDDEDHIVTPHNGSDDKPGDANTGAQDETVPGDGEHLDHPENWATGDEPATEKQKGFVAVLEKQKGVPVGDKEGMGKSEASEIIDKLKQK